MVVYLQSIRNKFVRTKDRETFASELIWEGKQHCHWHVQPVLTQFIIADRIHPGIVTSAPVPTCETLKDDTVASGGGGGDSKVSAIVIDLLQNMRMTLPVTPLRRLLNTFQSWRDLFALLDSSYSDPMCSQQPGEFHVKGVPEMCVQLTRSQQSHGELVSLLQEIVEVLDSSEHASTTSGMTTVTAARPNVTADLSLSDLRQYYSSLTIPVELQGDIAVDFIQSVSIVESTTIHTIDTDLWSLVENVLKEVHVWTHSLVVMLASCTRPIPLVGVLTLDFTPPAMIDDTGTVVAGVGAGVSECESASDIVNQLTMNLRSEYVTLHTHAKLYFISVKHCLHATITFVVCVYICVHQYSG